MKVLIPVKSVLQNGKFIINPFDDIAIECALQNKFNIHCVNISNDPAILKNCLAKGVQKVTLLRTDRNLTLDNKHSNNFLEPLHIAKIIHKFIKQNNFDMVMLGKQSTDTEFQCVGPMIASLWGSSQATNISKLTILNNIAENAAVGNQTYNIKVSKEIDTGREIVNLMTPTVITTDLRLAKPRYIPLSKLIKFKRVNIPTIELKDFANDINLDPTFQILNINEPKRTRKHIELTNVDELVKILKNYKRVD